MRRMESLLAASDVEWTAFRPPRLTNAAATGRYRIAIDTALSRAFSVSRANLAAAILSAIDNRALFRHAVTIAD
jgi:putative NADH-flavin reductase